MSPKWLCRPDVYRDPGDIAPWPGLANQKLIIELAEKSRLPAIYPFKEIVQAGGLMSYGIERPMADYRQFEKPQSEPSLQRLLLALRRAPTAAWAICDGGSGGC